MYEPHFTINSIQFNSGSQTSPIVDDTSDVQVELGGSGTVELADTVEARNDHTNNHETNRESIMKCGNITIIKGVKKWTPPKKNCLFTKKQLSKFSKKQQTLLTKNMTVKVQFKIYNLPTLLMSSLFWPGS